MSNKLWLIAFWLGFVAGGIFTYIALNNWMIDLLK